MMEKVRWIGLQMRQTREQLRQLRSEEEERTVHLQAAIRGSVSASKAQMNQSRAQLIEEKKLEVRS